MEKSRYSKIKKHLSVVRRLTGLTVEKFDEILKKIEPVYEGLEIERLQKKNRKRAFGGGRKQDLVLEDKLMMLFMYKHLYVTHEFLGNIFNLHNSNVSRQINYVEPLVRNVYTFPDNKIKLANTILNQTQILKIFVNLDSDSEESQKAIREYAGTSIRNNPVTGSNVVVNPEGRIIKRIKVTPLQKRTDSQR